MQCKGESMCENGGKMGKKSIVMEMMKKVHLPTAFIIQHMRAKFGDSER